MKHGIFDHKPDENKLVNPSQKFFAVELKTLSGARWVCQFEEIGEEIALEIFNNNDDTLLWVNTNIIQDVENDYK